MRIQEDSDKQIELQQTISNLTEQLEMSAICDEQNQNHISQLKKMAESMAENHELDKRRQETKVPERHRGYSFFSVKDRNLFHRVDKIGNITNGVHEMK